MPSLARLGLYGVAASGVIIAGFVQYIATHDTFRQSTFASMCNHMTNKDTSEMTPVRRQLLADASGHVLEIGPGPGTNFKCLASNAAVTRWTGVEPNPHMRQYSDAQLRAHGLVAGDAHDRAAAFPATLVDGTAEDMRNIADASVDTVVSTHVLCSVSDTDATLREVSRVLKPGGRFLFLEHVEADAESQPWLCAAQRRIAPVWHIIGDGCRFARTSDHLRAAHARGLFAALNVTEMSAPIGGVIGILVKPHVIGSATK